MERDFVSYEIALALKELGFNEECFGCYIEKKEIIVRVGDYRSFLNNNSEDTIIRNFNSYENGTISAPTFSQAFRWFREKYNIDFSIITNYAKVDSKIIKSYRVGFTIVKNNIIYSYFLRPENNKVKFIEFSTFEEAELECLKKLIEICKKN